MKKATILGLYQQGRSVNAIASQLGEDVDAVRHFLQDRGIKLVGRDAGEGSRRPSFYVHSPRRQDSMKPPEAFKLMKTWGIGARA